MNAATLKAAIHADLAPALIEATGSSDKAVPTALWTDISLQISTIIAEKVVAHIAANAVVSIPALAGTAAVPPGTCAIAPSTATIA